MSIPINDAGNHPWLVRLSSLVLISLASCARADPPELFVADPSLQNDFTDSLPATGSSGGFHYEIIQGQAILEGDILLGTVDSTGAIGSRFQARGLGKNDAFNRWPDGIIVYERPVNNSSVQQINVQLAIEHWTQNTTISFVERTTDNADQYPHYLQFVDSQGCASHVGMFGGAQPIYISDSCRMGNVAHEIGHAIGLFHEHTRPDRDNFVQIAWDDITDGKEINFSLQTANVATYSSYDYGSIMHYGPDSFSKTGNPTIIVSDDIQIGQREALSALDIQSVNKMYETDLALGTPTISSSDDSLEIDLTVYNQGELGAHQLQLVMQLADDSQWMGVSSNSGWNCLTYDHELKCMRETMREQFESRFTVRANPGSAAEEDLSIRLVSRTQDSNLSNNGVNDDGVEWQSLNDDPNPGSSGDTATIDMEQPESESNEATSPPPLSAANEVSERGVNDANAVQASAGSMPLSVMIFLLSMLGLRFHQRANKQGPAPVRTF